MSRRPALMRVFVLAGYFYQSLAAIALIFAVSHLVEGAGYTAFSLAAALSQLVCVFGFEWLQIAGTRFLAGAKPEERARLRAGLYVAHAASALLLIALSPLTLAFGSISGRLATLAFGLAIAQGLADLLFTIVRVEGRLALSAALLVFRSTGLVVAALVGAWLYRSAEAALAGMIVGQCLGVVAALVLDRGLLRFSLSSVQRADLVAFCRYGLVAAAASVVLLSANVGVRFLVVGHLGSTSQAAAGFSMAFDLLQRPFSVLVAALNMITYPEVVATYERAAPQDARKATGRLFEILLCPTLVLLAGMIAFVPDVAFLFVPAHLLPGFLAVAPAICAFSFANTHFQVSGAVVLHLLKAMKRLFVISLGQLAGIALAVWSVLSSGWSASAALFSASAVTMIWMVATAGPTIRFGAYPRPRLVLETLAVSAVILALSWVPSLPIVYFGLKLALAGLLTLLIVVRSGLLRGVARDGA